VRLGEWEAGDWEGDGSEWCCSERVPRRSLQHVGGTMMEEDNV
jgi:hypothetical protein